MIAIIAAMFGLIALRSGAWLYWEQQGFLRNLSETISFLHQRAISDGVYYRMEFHMNNDSECFQEKNNYCVRVGEVVPEEEDFAFLKDLSSAESGVGLLSLQLAVRQNPSPGTYQNMIAPRSIPSLGEPIYLPSGSYFLDIRSMRGLELPNSGDVPPYILFSPRGFSEFSVIHLVMSQNSAGEKNIVTILVNPFTGITQTFKGYKDFEWTYGRKSE